MTLPTIDIFLRCGAAVLLGGLVGLERERLERAAGLRTHALVAVASALMMIVSAYGFSDAVSPDRVSTLDPSRLAAQVVSGVGFLGAGVIIFQKNRVRGLTTAASIWSVAGIGLAAGGGLYVAAGIGTFFMLLIQAVLRPVERHFFVHHQEHRLVLRVRHGEHRLAAIERVVSGASVNLRRMRLREERPGEEDRLDLDLGTASLRAIPVLLDRLRGIEGVRVVSYSQEAGHPRRTDSGDDIDNGEESDDDAPGEHRSAARLVARRGRSGNPASKAVASMSRWRRRRKAIADWQRRAPEKP